MHGAPGAAAVTVSRIYKPYPMPTGGAACLCCPALTLVVAQGQGTSGVPAVAHPLPTVANFRISVSSCAASDPSFHTRSQMAAQPQCANHPSTRQYARSSWSVAHTGQGHGTHGPESQVPDCKPGTCTPRHDVTQLEPTAVAGPFNRIILTLSRKKCFSMCQWFSFRM